MKFYVLRADGSPRHFKLVNGVRLWLDYTKEDEQADNEE